VVASRVMGLPFQARLSSDICWCCASRSHLDKFTRDTKRDLVMETSAELGAFNRVELYGAVGEDVLNGDEHASL
jgi:hypothetical protein